MKRTAQIVSWVFLALFLASAFGVFGGNPNAVSPASLVPLLPFASALAVYHFDTPRWFAWIAFVLNCFTAFIGLAACAAAVLYGGSGDAGVTVIVILVVLLPTAFNTVALWRYLDRRDAVPAS